MKQTFLAFIMLAFLFTSCQNAEENTGNETVDSLKQMDQNLLVKAQKLFKVLPEVFEKEGNPITEAKVKLGKMLYFDTRLSKDKTQSCNTCHDLATFGVDNLPTSPGDNGGLGTRNSPTVFNAAIHASQFWDGREPDVEAQAGGPVLNPVEMAMPDEASVLKRLSGVEGYVALFAEAFPDEKKPLTYENIKNAIGAFERTVMTTDNFDEYLNGKVAALSKQERKGLDTYITVGCATCHAGPALGGDLLMKFGLHTEYAPLTGSKVVDNGKMEETKNEADKFIFKSQSLRNIEKTQPYFHDGSVTDLKEAIQIMAKTELGKTLSDEELNDIHAFLLTLTGDISNEKKAVPVLF